MSHNQLNYISKYNKENYKMYPFRVKKNDIDIINKLENISNRNAYITGLIKEDIDSKVLTIKAIKEKIKPIMSKHNIKDVYLFGSYARGEANSNSDVDIYCDSGDLRSLYFPREKTRQAVQPRHLEKAESRMITRRSF